jgi:hypothetical protein
MTLPYAASVGMFFDQCCKRPPRPRARYDEVTVLAVVVEGVES